MGRHSAPDDTDEDVELDDPAVGGGTDVALATGPQGRHSRGDGDRPRPTPGGDGHPPGEGLGLIDDALSDDAPTDAETLTTEIPLADIARGDRPVPEETTARIAPVADAPVADAPTTAPDTAPTPDSVPPTRRGGHATRQDLALIRAHGDVRARAIAAVVVPFVVFVAVLAVIGELNVRHLIYIIAPAVAAGVLVGLVLDHGHKQHPDLAHDGEPAPVGEPADPA